MGSLAVDSSHHCIHIRFTNMHETEHSHIRMELFSFTMIYAHLQIVRVCFETLAIDIAVMPAVLFLWAGS